MMSFSEIVGSMCFLYLCALIYYTIIDDSWWKDKW